jgi:alpha/beta superfamily hydrolase
MHNTMNTIFIPGSSGDLEALYHAHDQAPLMIICHPHPLYQGTMNNKVVTTLAQAASSLNLAALRFNFRGVGQSAGEYANAEGEQDDLNAVIRWAITEINPPSLILAGFSFGAYISSKVAASYSGTIPLKALITIAPPIGNFPFETLGSIAVPWLCVQGDADEVVSFPKVEQWAAIRKDITQFTIFPHCSHFFHGRLVELRTVVQTWLQDLL